MFRLTELERQQHRVTLRIEGHLSRPSLDLLMHSIDACQAQGCTEVLLQADGVLGIDHRLFDEHRWPQGVAVRFLASRPLIHQQLLAQGLAVELVPE